MKNSANFSLVVRCEEASNSRFLSILGVLASMVAVVSCAPKVPPTSCPDGGKALSANLPYADMRPLPCHWHDCGKEGELERPRKFASYSYPYAIASVKAYDDDPKEASIPFPAEEQWKPLDGSNHYTECQIGFAAKSWLRTKRDGTKELVVAFRGTQFTQWPDWRYANLVPVMQASGSNQYKSALSYAHSMALKSGADRSGIPIVLTGHSLGGGLAEYCQRFIGNSEAITFDPSPNQGVLYALGQRDTKKSAVRVYEKGEILSYLRFIASPDVCLEPVPDGDGVRAIWMDFYSSNLIAAHGMHDLAMSLVKVAVSHGDRGANSIYDRMMNDWCEGRIQSGKVIFPRTDEKHKMKARSVRRYKF